MDFFEDDPNLRQVRPVINVTRTSLGQARGRYDLSPLIVP